MSQKNSKEVAKEIKELKCKFIQFVEGLMLCDKIKIVGAIINNLVIIIYAVKARTYLENCSWKLSKLSYNY